MAKMLSDFNGNGVSPVSETERLQRRARDYRAQVGRLGENKSQDMTTRLVGTLGHEVMDFVVSIIEGQQKQERELRRLSDAVMQLTKENNVLRKKLDDAEKGRPVQLSGKGKVTPPQR